MIDPVTRLLFGGGRFDATLRAQLEAEDSIVLEEALRGSVTFRNYDGPGRRTGWKREPIVAGLAVTARRLVVVRRGGPLVDVPFDDERFVTAIKVSAEDEELAIDVLDAGAFDDRASGMLDVRLRMADPGIALEAMPAEAG